MWQILRGMAACSLGTWLKRTKTSHAEFARRLGVTDSAVWRWAHGERSPKITVAFRIEELTRGAVRASSWVKPPKARPVVRRAPRLAARDLSKPSN
jgi:transcriptional regulator with XRE-family HTH domain